MTPRSMRCRSNGSRAHFNDTTLDNFGTLTRAALRLRSADGCSNESNEAHLHQVEQVGESAETPFIAIVGVVLFLAPIFALMLGLAFAAYYLVG